MVSAGVSIAAAGGAFAANPILGFVVLTAAAIVDQFVVVPALQGKGRGKVRPERLLGVPADSNEPGAPRVWALGRRIRVPTHTLWQDLKALETAASSSKRGTGVAQRRTYFDALIAINDRETRRLVQLRGNNTMLLFNSRNLVSTESANMVVSVVGPRLVLTAGSTSDPDFTTKHKIGDAVKLSGFVMTSGADINGYWKVADVVEHGASPGRIELTPFDGQLVLGVAATAGTPFSPASVTRVDDVVFVEGTGATSPTGFPSFTFNTASHLEPNSLFVVGDPVTLENLIDGSGADVGLIPAGWIAFQVLNETEIQIRVASGGSPSSVQAIGPTKAGRIRPRNPKPFAAPLFPPTFDPSLYYHSGTETQGEDALIVQKRGTGNVSAYRGIAYQGLDDFFANDFGNALPFAMEAIIDPDSAMTWGEAVRTILRERGGIPDDAIDVEGIDNRPFLGAYFRGNAALATAIQPVLVAGQLITQERDGAIAVFDIGNSEVVEILNGSISHLGCRLDGEPATDEKVNVEDAAPEDLPTSMGIRHQDPDNQFADGYQHFGLRNPFGFEWENDAEFDLSNVVLTRKDARNLATTTLRRAHINARTYRLVLPANYLHLLESDVVTFTDDEGQVVSARIIQRDIGSDFRVAITAVREEIDLSTVASPVQSAAGSEPPALVTAGAINEAHILDIPAWKDEDALLPSLAFALDTTSLEDWAGAVVYESPDGTTYTQVGTVNERAIIGRTVGFAWDAYPSSESYGTTDVTVSSYGTNANTQFTDESISVDSVTAAEAARGANWFAVIDPENRDAFEIIAAVKVGTDGTPGKFYFETMLRGLRGTTPRGWLAGSVVVQLTTSTGAPAPGLWRRVFPGTIQPTALVYKLVPPGLSLDDVEPIGVSAKWHNARPLPVRSVSKLIGSSPFNATLTVVAHWCRDVQEVGTQPPHPMDEPSEGYLFSIYDPTGSSVVRTKTITATPGSGTPTLRDKWVTYTAAEQTADGYTPSGTMTFVVDVQQIGQFGLSPSRKQTV
jgi:hypothetical protein